MKRLRSAVLYLACLPMDLLGLFLLAVMTLGAKATWARRGRTILATPAKDSWVAAKWHYSTTFGHAIFLHPHSGYQVLQHELVHTRQAEAACVAWWLITLVAWSPTLVYLSPFAWLAIYGSSCAAAWLARREAYEGSVFEEHARAETEQ